MHVTKAYSTVCLSVCNLDFSKDAINQVLVSAAKAQCDIISNISPKSGSQHDAGASVASQALG